MKRERIILDALYRKYKKHDRPHVAVEDFITLITVAFSMATQFETLQNTLNDSLGLLGQIQTQVTALQGANDLSPVQATADSLKTGLQSLLTQLNPAPPQNQTPPTDNSNGTVSNPTPTQGQ
jgi:hypothetical protein